MKKLWQNPEYRARMLAKLKESGPKRALKMTGVLNARYKHGRSCLNGLTQAQFSKKRRTENRAYIHSLKTDVPCTDCGKTYPPYVLDFDHLGIEPKRRNVSNLCHFQRELIDAEIAKCEIVCANCHRHRTHVRRHLALSKKSDMVSTAKA